MLIFGIFIIYPTLSGIRMAFYEWSVLEGHSFIGVQNFFNVFKDKMFWITLKNTLIYVGSVVPLLIVVSLGIGFLASKAVKGIGLFRACYYLPTMLSLIMVGIAWRWILGDEIGILNFLIKTLLGGEPVSWLTSTAMAMASLIFVTVWQGAGFYMIIFIGGLQSIPDTVYEAAYIDGASKFQTFRHITLPLLKPTTLVVAVLATINAFKAFELIYVMTGGGPGYSTKFLVQNIYLIAFEEDRMGYAAAMSIVLLIVIGLLTSVQFLASGKEYANE
ncbi:MAG: sugar ABC transporter permease [bacterium]|nr:sugar ABC transporter permease [bacterium]